MRALPGRHCVVSIVAMAEVRLSVKRAATLGFDVGLGVRDKL
jgi:hypothetical protein